MTAVTAPEHADALATAIVGVTGAAVEETAPGSVTTDVASRSDADRLSALLAARFPGTRIEIAAVPAVDWSSHWRDGLSPLRLGRLVVTPSWIAVEPRPDRVVVSIDPESAFGSGAHGSTRGALALLERHVRRGDRVVDLGSGSGVLGIAAAKLGAVAVIGVEIDPDAVPIAEANAVKNCVDGRVRFVIGDAGDLLPLVAPAELICCNILRDDNAALLPAIAAALTPGGVAVLAGLEAGERSAFEPLIAAAGLATIASLEDDGWWAVAARRR